MQRWSCTHEGMLDDEFFGDYVLYADATDPIKIAEELNKQGFVVVTKEQWDELNDRREVVTAIIRENEVLTRKNQELAERIEGLMGKEG